VVGSHLSTDPIERPGQATLLKKAMSELDAPVIVGTDLNESPGGTAWHTVADGLVDSAVAADRAEVQTFSCANPQGRIDALFVDPAIQVRGYDVVDTAETRRASDHFPLVADLTLPD
jgi:endonuclease/exonuclease/phosphatase family metal-dependent hydrolase